MAAIASFSVCKELPKKSEVVQKGVEGFKNLRDYLAIILCFVCAVFPAELNATSAYFWMIISHQAEEIATGY